MGRKTRNTAKTGDVALYKSRDDNAQTKKKLEDNDATYNEVDRYVVVSSHILFFFNKKGTNLLVLYSTVEWFQHVIDIIMPKMT